MTRFNYILSNVQPECKLLLEEEKDDSQEYAKLKEGIAFYDDSVYLSDYASDEVRSFLRSLIPDGWGCSCHIAPPCNYCVDYGHIVMAIKDLEE